MGAVAWGLRPHRAIGVTIWGECQHGPDHVLTISSDRIMGLCFLGGSPAGPAMARLGTTGNMMSDTDELDLESRRRAMVMIVAAYVRLCAEELGKERLSDRVMQAMTTVPRHRFVPAELEEWAYEDTPLPIGQGKTISQPFMVALMTDLLAIKESDKVLEIGTGLGYQSAILAELAKHVFSVEIIEELANEAERRLRSAGYDNVQLRIGDGSRGWIERGPFDKIMVSAAPRDIPQRLLGQLKAGGKMVLPLGGEDDQTLIVVEKGDDAHVRTHELIAVRFSPLIVSN
jgi:protein-L-isoaspartate(D-aspartate) O-methyltransferase